MLDSSNDKKITKSRIIFFILTSIVPFMIYSGYYYYKMISKAPFRFVDFKSFQVEYNNPTNDKGYKYDSDEKILHVTNQYKIVDAYKIVFSKDELHSLHRHLVENIFFDMPSTIGDNPNKQVTYKIKVCYSGKCKQVIVYYVDKSVYAKKIDNIKHYIETKFKNL